MERTFVSGNKLVDRLLRVVDVVAPHCVVVSGMNNINSFINSDQSFCVHEENTHPIVLHTTILVTISRDERIVLTDVGKYYSNGFI